MISPFILQLLFWAAIGGTLYGTYVLIKLGNWAWFFPLIFGPLVARIIFERLMIAFQSYEKLCDIHQQITQIKGIQDE
jgi:hypothetical protein